jgi:phage-related protein
MSLSWAESIRTRSHSRGTAARGFLKSLTTPSEDTYRAVYTVRFTGAIYVLHAFQKKSKRGIKTPQRELDLIGERLKRAEREYASWGKSRT